MRPKYAVQEMKAPLTTLFGNSPSANCHDGHSEPTFEDVKRTWVVLVMTDRYKMLKRAVPTYKITAFHIGSMFMISWAIAYGITAYISVENRT